MSTPRATIAKPYIGYAFNLLFRYATTCDWGVKKIIDAVLIKNDKNFPVKLFLDGKTPFENPIDAITCSRLLRKEIEFKKNSNLSKNKIKQILKSIVKNGKPENQVDANDLLEKGSW